MKTYLTADNGKTIVSPQFFRRGMRKIASLNRQLSRKQKGGSNRCKAKRRLAREHIRIADRRRDWCFKEAHALCDAYDVMYFEDLNLDGMKRLWGRKVRTSTGSDSCCSPLMTLDGPGRSWTPSLLPHIMR